MGKRSELVPEKNKDLNCRIKSEEMHEKQIFKSQKRVNECIKNKSIK